MQVQTINNNTPSFGVLKITPKAKALIERERGGKYRIKKYTKELENSRWNLYIKHSEYYGFADTILPAFGDKRSCYVSPRDQKDEFVMVTSIDDGDIDKDIVDCLKFSSVEKAKEVYETLKKYMRIKNDTPLQKLDEYVYAMKAFTEAELVPQKETPWASWRERFDIPVQSGQAVNAEPVKKKPVFIERLRTAWDVLLGK